MIRPRPAQINGMALVAESDEAFNPVDVRVLSPDAVVFKANLVSDTGEKSRGIGECCRTVLGSHFRPRF
jgi:hypothetical protein